MRSALRLASAAILSLLCAISVFAQASQTGGITGVVTDAGGALVTGATVDVIMKALENQSEQQPLPAMVVTRSRC